MSIPNNEIVIGSINTERKGKPRKGTLKYSPCIIAITSDNNSIYLRTIDDNNTSTCVAKLTPKQANSLAKILLKADLKK